MYIAYKHTVIHTHSDGEYYVLAECSRHEPYNIVSSLLVARNQYPFANVKSDSPHSRRAPLYIHTHTHTHIIPTYIICIALILYVFMLIDENVERLCRTRYGTHIVYNIIYICIAIIIRAFSNPADIHYNIRSTLRYILL